MKEKWSKFTSIFYTPILIYFFLLLGISLLAIASSLPLAWVRHPETNFVARQVMFFIIGSIATVTVLFIGIKNIRLIRWPLYGLFLFLLIPILLFGAPDHPLFPEVNGAARWINLGVMSLQPSEFLRIALILVVADIIQKHNEKIPHETRTFKSDFFLIVKSFGIVLIPSFLIFIQPDSGITILILITTALMLLTAGIKWTYILVVAGSALVFLYVFMFLVINHADFLINTIGIESYRIDRFDALLDPFGTISGVGHQLARALTGMGSGGIFGHGFQSHAVHFPEAHTDLIFAVIGMDFGMIGSVIVISICLLLNVEILNTAILNRDHYNSHVCVGIFASLMAQQFWNIGMLLGLLPITGVTLPFVSFGGSSVLASMIMLGLILSSHIEGKSLKHHDASYKEGILYLS